MTEVGKICDFQLINRCISETVRDTIGYY